MGQQESALLRDRALVTNKTSIDPDTVDDFALKGRHIVQIVDVYDGDTLTFIMLYGDKPLKLKLRLLGCDTPELRGKTQAEREAAAQARNRLIELLGWKSYKPGQATHAEVELVSWDKWGSRVLGHVYCPNSNISAADVLVAERLARPYNGEKKPLWEPISI